jgi:hypothetical protein
LTDIIFNNKKEIPMKKVTFIIAIVFILAGCNADSPKGKEAPQNMPAPAMPATAAPAAGYSGTVVSTKDASNYTYLEIKGKDGIFWAAVPQTKVAAGAAVELIGPIPMKNFDAKVLGKKFDSIIFAGGVMVNGKQAETAGKAPATAAAGAQQQKEPAMDASAHMKADTATDASEVKKAEGGVTIAEILANPASFKDKKVLLRTKVTKFLPEIMKKNWLHLKDASVKDKDIVATSAEQFKVGDVVLIEGIVKTNQDLGFGYKYDVLIEETVKK